MKIIFAVENYYPLTGGVQVVVQYLAERLAKRGNEVSVVTRIVPGEKDIDIINGVTVYRKNLYYGTFKNSLGEINDYIKFLKEINAEVYIFECTQCITTDIVLPHLNSIQGIKILHSHGFSGLMLKPFKRFNDIKHTLGNTFNWLRWKKYYKLILPKYIDYFDAVVCLSQCDSSYNYLFKHCKSKLFILGNAVDDMFFATNKEHAINKYVDIKGKGFFLSVANYLSDKNQMGILREFYLSEVKDYDMIFIGTLNNEYYKLLQLYNNELSQRYSVRNVHFLLNVDRIDIPSIMEDAKLYLVGSRIEAFSIAVIESMAKGIPFISTNVGNVSELPGGKVIDDISNMHEAIKELIKNPQAWEIASQKEKKYAYKYCNIDRAVDSLLEIIEHVYTNKY